MKFSILSKKKGIQTTFKLFGLHLTPIKIKAILFGLSFLIYANTITHDYTQDDAIVIYDNMFVEQGVSGIPGLLKYDTFYGFFKEEGKAALVSGGRYRPFTPIMFAVEWQIYKIFAGSDTDIKTIKPYVGHLINVLLFGLLVVLLFSTLYLLLKETEFVKDPLKISFFAALIFAVHPIHTEVVANIKGRDEIVALLASLYALYLVLKSIKIKSNKPLIAALVVFFIGLMSKENTITFLAVIPLALIMFKNIDRKEIVFKSALFLIPSILFIIIRSQVLNIGLGLGGDPPMELMNNPFLKVENNQYVHFDLSEKLATIMYTLGKYLNLLFFPHPLSHDYYPRQVGIMSWKDITVILSLIMYVVMTFGAIRYFKRNKLVSFSILYFLITLSIVSNIVFPIGTNMSERFMFMPSVGFSLFIASMLTKIKNEKLILGLLGIMIFALSAKTITRNNVWKDDFTLFTTDVKTSKNSAKLLNAAGGALTTEAGKLPDGPEKTKMLNEALIHLNKAVKIHPNYKNAYLLMGNANNLLKKYEQSIANYELGLRLSPSDETINRNLGITLQEAGRYYGEEKRDMATALKYLKRAYSIDSKNYVTVRLLGVASGLSKDQAGAIRYFTEAVALWPDSGLTAEQKKSKAQAFVDLGTAYRVSQNQEKANENFQKAVALDPAALNHLQ